MTSQQQLDQLEQEIMDNNVCPELRDQATQLVFGSGNPDADVMFIGEAPGAKEDISGEPFVGASGKMLNEMLEQATMKRSDSYITNIVKYRPPDNRDPSVSEKNEFWPYLLKQIAIIKPKIMATLGRHAGSVFLPDLIIGKDHGKPKHIKVELDGKEEDILIMPLYHPAAALYNGSLRQTLFDDFKTAAQLIKEA